LQDLAHIFDHAHLLILSRRHRCVNVDPNWKVKGKKRTSFSNMRWGLEHALAVISSGHSAGGAFAL
jgi:hypothetical protein